MEERTSRAGQSSRRDALKLAGAVAVGGAAALAVASLPFETQAALAAGRFSVEIDGVVVAGISKVAGLQVSTDVIEFREGSDPSLPQAIPGNHHPGRVRLSKDWSSTHEFFNWRKTVLDGKVERKSISIVFQNDSRDAASRINLYRCWPVKWEGPDLDAKSGTAVAIETIEIVWEGIEVK
jgi:phage tail-like protein